MKKYIESFGVVKSKKDIRDYRAVCATPESAFPEEFELEICPIKNQGSQPTCVAHALASVVEFYNREQEGEYKEMSTVWIYGNRTETNYHGEGMDVREALHGLKNSGTPPVEMCAGNYGVDKSEQIYADNLVKVLPYAYPNRITSYFTISGDNAVKACLIQNNPVVATLDWNAIEYNANTKSYKPKQGDGQAMHCVYIYGWNKQGWKIANSWGEWWGDKGTAILDYDVDFWQRFGVIDEFSTQATQLAEAKYLEAQQALTAKIGEIAALESKIDDLKTTISQVQKASEAQTLEIENANRLIEHFNKETAEFEKEIALKNEELNALSERAEKAEKEAEQAQQTLIEIKKPFSSGIGKIIAKIVNFIMNLFVKEQ